MASLEAFVLCFCALDHVDYARWFPIHKRHEYTLTGIQKILSTLLGAAEVAQYICMYYMYYMRQDQKQRFHQNLL